jgi:hypothetical protein
MGRSYLLSIWEKTYLMNGHESAIISMLVEQIWEERKPPTALLIARGHQ